MKRIYFDHSATTPVDPKVFEKIEPYFKEKFGNPSSIHDFGREAMTAVDESRQEIASFLNCLSEEVVFTSGATESNNLVIKGVVKALEEGSDSKNHVCRCRGSEQSDSHECDGQTPGPHLITTSVEHKAVLEPCAELEKQGVEVSYLPVNEKGVIKLEDLEKEIKENTVLVSVMYVNSEVGSIQPVQKVGKIVKKINEQRLREWQKWGAKKQLPKPQKLYFHTDATQALNFFNCDVQKLRADFLSLSGHKIYGPKGVGALYVRKGSQLKPVQLGGHHERGFRSGTLNTPGIVGLGKAVSLLSSENQDENNKKIAELRDYLVKGIKDNIPDAFLTTDTKEATPAHAHFIFKGAEGESILMSLDLEGIAVSTGSACAAKDLHPSHVLKAMGVKSEDANCCIRFSLGKKNTKKDIDRLLEILPGAVERIRKINPLYKK